MYIIAFSKSLYLYFHICTLCIADEADNILTCVGFWMEDMKSYLITWDEEDAISSYRCWVRSHDDNSLLLIDK